MNAETDTLEPVQTLGESAEAIDILLDDDDGLMLAAAAELKINLLRFFKREGLVAELKAAVAAAKHVNFYSRRSEREISLTRPQVNLLVDIPGAFADPACAEAFIVRGARLGPDLGNGSGRGPRDSDIDSCLARIVHAQVCVPFATVLIAKLSTQWEKAKHLMDGRKDPRLLLATIFEITIEQIPEKLAGSPQAKPASERMSSLHLFL